MDQDTTVKKLMLEIKIDDDVPPKYQGFIRKYLRLCYVMGFDAGVDYNELYHIGRVAPHITPVDQYDKHWNIIAHYASIEQAKNKTDISVSAILHSLRTGALTRHQFHWKRVPKETNQHKNLKEISE
jgi:hypothetical protein